MGGATRVAPPHHPDCSLEYLTLSVIHLLVLHSLATRWYCEQIMPPEINPFVNHLAEKINEASSVHHYPGLSSNELMS